MCNNIWQGVYTNFSQIQAEQQYSFDTSVWIESQIRDLNNILDSKESTNYKYLLRLIFDLYSLSKESIKILILVVD